MKDKRNFSYSEREMLGKWVYKKGLCQKAKESACVTLDGAQREWEWIGIFVKLDLFKINLPMDGFTVDGDWTDGFWHHATKSFYKNKHNDGLFILKACIAWQLHVVQQDWDSGHFFHAENGLSQILFGQFVSDFGKKS